MCNSLYFFIACTQEVDSVESDYSQSPVEPNTVYYTPKHHLSGSSNAGELSQVCTDIVSCFYHNYVTNRSLNNIPKSEKC